MQIIIAIKDGNILAKRKAFFLYLYTIRVPICRLYKWAKIFNFFLLSIYPMFVSLIS